VLVRLANRTAGYEREYRLGHWGERSEPIRPGRRRLAAANSSRRSKQDAAAEDLPYALRVLDNGSTGSR
jgi:hypothetical protein